MSAFVPLVLVGHALQMGALLLCFTIFVVTTIRVLVLGSAHYERVARAPLDEAAPGTPSEIASGGDERSRS